MQAKPPGQRQARDGRLVSFKHQIIRPEMQQAGSCAGVNRERFAASIWLGCMNEVKKSPR